MQDFFISRFALSGTPFKFLYVILIALELIQNTDYVTSFSLGLIRVHASQLERKRKGDT